MKTECSRLELGFLGRRQVVGQFDGGRISSDGGAVLLAEIDRAGAVTKRLADCIRDRRQSSKVRQTVLDMLRQRIYQIACGYEDCNDAETLAADPVFKTVVERCPVSDPDLASQPTLSRFENSISPTDLYRMAETLVELFIAHTSRPPRRIILDIDATVDPTHGAQQLTFFHGYYGTHCYLPLLVFASADGASQQLLAAALRPGNVHAGRGTVAILKRLVARLRAAWPDTRIIVRGDSGFALPEAYAWCEESGVDYLIGLIRNGRLQALIEPLLRRAQKEHRLTGQKARLIGETSYAAGSWPHERRVILKAEVTNKGDNPRFVVTSIQETPPDELYQLYAQRGEAENRIKELKNDLAADRTSCHRFLPNQFRLLLHAFAFLLMSWLRDLLTGTELAAAQVQTLRAKLLKVGVRVCQTARKVWLHFASAYPLKRLWDTILQRIRVATA